MTAAWRSGCARRGWSTPASACADWRGRTISCRHAGAFEEAVNGNRNCVEAGVKTGNRFTLNASNYHDLGGVLELAEV